MSTNHYPPEPDIPMEPPRDRKPRRWPWIAGMVVALLVGYGAGSSSTDVDEDPSAKADESSSTVDPAVVEEEEEDSAPEPEPEPVVLPDPNGEVSAFCDSHLDSDLSRDQEGRYKFLATLDAENTGNVDIEVEVWVDFNQLGSEPVRYSESLEIPVGETATVYIDESITSEQWDRYHDAGRNCDIGIELIDYDEDSVSSGEGE